MSKLSTKNLAMMSGRHPWVSVGAWLVIIVIAVALSSVFLKGALTTEDKLTNNAESQRASSLVENRLGEKPKERELVIISSPSLKVMDPAFKSFVTDLQKDLKDLGGKIVDSSFSFYLTRDPSLVSTDGKATIVQVVMAGTKDDAKANIDRVHEVVNKADKDGRFEVLIAGGATASKQFSDLAESDLRTGELYGISAALVILALVSGTVVAALVPLLLAVVAIAPAIGATALVGHFFDLSFFVVNMITMMGLAVGIDYSLFIISRYREEQEKGLDRLEAIAVAGGTAGRAVLFSGAMVILALLGLMIVPHTTFKSLSVGAVLAVVFAVLAALTLLPAILRLLGDKIDALRIPFFGRKIAHDDDQNGFWNALARVIMRRPVISLVSTIVLMAVLIAPYFSLKIGMNGVESMPDSLKAKKAFTTMNERFPMGKISSAQVTIDGAVDSAQVKNGIERLKKSIAKDSDFAPAMVKVEPKKDAAVLTVPIKAESNSDKAIEAVKRLRADYIPRAFSGDAKATVLVGGETAGISDFLKANERYTPYVFAFVLGLSFILLMLVFRSLVVPAKAILMNLMSVGAAYGLTVLVFQKGIGAKMLGFQKVDAIEAWLPLFLFAILFGLSMDYHVFLLSRIRERYDHTKNSDEAVAFGLRSTGRIITGAAFIMVAVFTGFASGELSMLQQMGFGLAIAVFLDATIIRSILVPSGMKLLGGHNWYFPKFLHWLPNLNVEGGELAEE